MSGSPGAPTDNAARTPRRPARRGRAALAAMMAAVSAATLSGCGTTVTGHASLSMYDPFKVGDLPAEDGPSGVKPDAPAPTGTVADTDNGDLDRIALLATNDVADYWQQHYGPLPGSFSPITELQSYDARTLPGRSVCQADSYQLINAMYCIPEKTIFWDRGVLLANTRKYFGDMGIAGVLAHEYGHAIQIMAKTVDRKTPGLVFEQQADCFAGNYLAWVGAGKSPRFQMSTADGLNHVLAGGIYLRDPLLDEDYSDELQDGHGSALDRIGAFQIGFLEGPEACAKIDIDEITRRRGDLPLPLRTDTGGGNLPVTAETVTALTDTLGMIFSPQQPPKLALTPQPCPDAEPTAPAGYCPATNTVFVDLPALAALGTPATEAKQRVLLQGDNTAISALTSRYTLALQHERGLPLNDAAAALRTACLTGAAQRAMSDPETSKISLAGGDIDEAVAGLLTNGIAASDVNGAAAPAGFTRILAFRSGLLGTADGCYGRF